MLFFCGVGERQSFVLQTLRCSILHTTRGGRAILPQVTPRERERERESRPRVRTFHFASVRHGRIPREGTPAVRFLQMEKRIVGLSYLCENVEFLVVENSSVNDILRKKQQHTQQHNNVFLAPYNSKQFFLPRCFAGSMTIFRGSTLLVSFFWGGQFLLSSTIARSRLREKNRLWLCCG